MQSGDSLFTLYRTFAFSLINATIGYYKDSLMIVIFDGSVVTDTAKDRWHWLTGCQSKMSVKCSLWYSVHET